MCLDSFLQCFEHALVVQLRFKIFHWQQGDSRSSFPMASHRLILFQKLKQYEKAIEFFGRNEGESEAILKRYEIEGQNVILYFDEVNTYRTITQSRAQFSTLHFSISLVKKSKKVYLPFQKKYCPSGSLLECVENFFQYILSSL